MSAPNKFNQADHRGGDDVALTPPHVIAALGGYESFELDPCSCPEPRPWPTAKRHVTLPEDGLSTPWEGSVWCNPPYSAVGAWAARMNAHACGVLLVFARTETSWFHEHVLSLDTSASGVLFLRGRLQFFNRFGGVIRTKAGTVSNAGAPSCLVSYDPAGGADNLARLIRAVAVGTLDGRVIPLKRG